MIRLAESQYLGMMGPVDLHRFARTVRHWSRLTPRPTYFPEVLWIETTNACNLRCAMCPQRFDDARAHGRMDDDLLARVLDQAAGRCFGVFLFFGGEPLCDPEYARRVRMARERGLRVFVHTNAVLFDEDRARELLDAEPTTVSVSLDTADPERYEHFRVGATFEETLANTTAFIRLAGERKRRPLTIVQLIDVNGSGARDAAALRERMAPHLPDEFRIRPLHDWAGELSDELGESAQRSNPYYPCVLLWKAMVICHDGRVAACCNDLNCRIEVGDAARDSLMDIWTGDAMVALRESLVSGEKLHPLCAGCVNLWHPRNASLFWRAARWILGGSRKLGRRT